MPSHLRFQSLEKKIQVFEQNDLPHALGLWHFTETETSDLSINFKNFVIGGKKIELLDTLYFDLQKNNTALFFE